MIVECMVYKWMNVWFFIFDYFFVGKSDENGRLVILNLFVGKWILWFNYEKLGYL